MPVVFSFTLLELRNFCVDIITSLSRMGKKLNGPYYFLPDETICATWKKEKPLYAVLCRVAVVNMLLR